MSRHLALAISVPFLLVVSGSASWAQGDEPGKLPVLAPGDLTWSLKRLERRPSLRLEDAGKTVHLWPKRGSAFAVFHLQAQSPKNCCIPMDSRFFGLRDMEIGILPMVSATAARFSDGTWACSGADLIIVTERRVGSGASLLLEIAFDLTPNWSLKATHQVWMMRSWRNPPSAPKGRQGE